MKLYTLNLFLISEVTFSSDSSFVESGVSKKQNYTWNKRIFQLLSFLMKPEVVNSQHVLNATHFLLAYNQISWD